MQAIDINAALPGTAKLPAFLKSWIGLTRIQPIYERLATGHMAAGLLHQLGVTVDAGPNGLALLPQSGPAIVVANHPHGILDGAVLLDLLSRVRSDVKFLANRALAGIPELRTHLIAVDLYDARPNTAALRHAISHVAEGGLLVIFPAGEVSVWKPGAGVSDREWQPGAGRLLELIHKRTPQLPVIPIHIGGRNSILFQAAAQFSEKFRTALLIRELWNQQGATVPVRIGKPVLYHPNRQTIAHLRWRVELLSKREPARPLSTKPLYETPSGARVPIAGPIPPQAIAAEIAPLAPVAENAGLRAYVARAWEIPQTLQEIGRLREITFRAEGEGTGLALDLDEFDRHYLHLFLYDASNQKIAGAYRMKPVLPGQTRVQDLYTSTLFHYKQDFLHKLGPSLELGRSFVTLEYQKSFSALLLLWKAIGAWVAAHPEHGVLFGPVSISSRYAAESRRLIASFLRKAAWLGDWSKLVRGRHTPRWSDPAITPDTIEDLEDAVSEIEGAQSGVPVLIRQYLKLGGRLAGFHIDAAFSDSLDGLIVVDLAKTESRQLKKYLGPQGAEQFLAWQQHKEQRTWKAAS